MAATSGSVSKKRRSDGHGDDDALDQHEVEVEVELEEGVEQCHQGQVTRQPLRQHIDTSQCK